MSLTKITAFLSVLLMAVASTAFAGDASLTSRADSLKDELKNLKNVFGQRDPGFIRSTSAVFKYIDRARDSAGDVEKRAGQGASRKDVGVSVNDLTERMAKLRDFVKYINLTDRERATVRNVDVKFGMLLGAWDGYQSGGSSPAYLPPPPRPNYPPSGPTYGYKDYELNRRARMMTMRYIAQRWGAADQDVEIERISNIGDRHRVIALIRGRERVIEIDAESGRVYLDRPAY